MVRGDEGIGRQTLDLGTGTSLESGIVGWFYFGNDVLFNCHCLFLIVTASLYEINNPVNNSMIYYKENVNI